MKTVEVAAGVLRRADGHYLLAERAADKHLGGYLEFPGGKLEPGETSEAALARELAEELGVTVTRAEPLVQFAHDYPGYRVRACMFRVLEWRGEPQGREGQRLVYAAPETLRELPLLPANRPILAALELPATLLVTPRLDLQEAANFLPRFGRALRDGRPGGAILRLKGLSNRGFDPLLSEVATSFCRSGGPRRDRLGNHSASPSRRGPSLLQLNIGKVVEPPPGFTGLHLPATVLMALERRPDIPGWIGASVHNAAEAERAGALGFDYVIAGSLRETPSHPDVAPLGWKGFDAIVRAAGIPVYAIGGMTPADVPDVRRHWGQGIAAIRALWDCKE